MSQPGVQLQSRWDGVAEWAIHTRVADSSADKDVPLIILVHGLGVSSRYMVPTARLLAKRYCVFAPDLPGFGRSSKPSHVLTMAELVESLAGWMQVIGLSSAVFLGNSLSCQLLVHLALHEPARVERLILVGPMGDPTGRSFSRLLARGLIDLPRERASLLPILAHDYLAAGSIRVIKTLLNALNDPIEEYLPRVRVPALVVRGGRDPVVSQGWAEQVSALLPMGRLVVLPGSPHAPNYSRPVQLVQAIQPFLSITGSSNSQDVLHKVTMR